MAEVSLTTWHETVKGFSRLNDLIFYGEIDGHFPSGKNNYRMGRGRMYRAPEVEAYEELAAYRLNQMKARAGRRRPFPAYENKKPVFLALVAQIWFRDMRRDVDTILLCDILQKAGVIENDRMIRMKLINGVEIDAAKPRVEFGLYRL